MNRDLWESAESLRASAKDVCLTQCGIADKVGLGEMKADWSVEFK